MREITIDETTIDQVPGSLPRRYLPLLLVLFLGSGCAALIYEVVWFQLLELVIGASTVSLGILLGTFMGGMCLGSLVFPYIVPRDIHPLRVYATMELAIGIIGLILLFGMPLIAGTYTAWAGSGLTSMLLRGIVAGMCLLPPTLLMGATLPAMARWVETTPTGVSWLGFFYGGNIGGAVVGSLLAGMYLLRVYDAATATYVAVAINAAVAILALGIAKATAYTPAAAEPYEANALSTAWPVYVAIALSGMTALASEVIWTRVLSLLFGATVYTFSLILAVFLVGLGFGSTMGSALSKGLTRPRMVLAWCQILLCGAIAWAAIILNRSLPYWPLDPSLATGPWQNIEVDIVRTMWAVLPAAILWGASFPLALAAVATHRQDPARLVGGVYAANTLGAIVGSLGASLVLVAWFGSQHAQQMMIGLAAISALLILVSARPISKSTAAVVVMAVYAGLLVYMVPELPVRLVEYGRFAAIRGKDNTTVYMGEGLTASVAVSKLPDGIMNYHNAGKVQASSDPADMKLQRMLGHLTTLVPENPRSVMVIGCGAGVTAGAVSIEPRLEHETIVEIEPLVPSVVSTYFGDYNFNVVKNPKVRVRIDDGRHFLFTTKEKFDGITSDPLDPWVKGAAALYTKEFFEVAKQHLNPGGVVTQFVQLYESNEEAVKSEIATFFEVFPNGLVFANTVAGQGYDVVLVGQAESARIDIDKMEARLNSAGYAPLAKSLSEIGIFSAVDLLSTFAGQGSDLKGWLKDATINHDRNLRLQYLAGLGLNLYQADPIYKNMVAFARYPDQLFTGSDASLQRLRQAMSFPQNQ